MIIHVSPECINLILGWYGIWIMVKSSFKVSREHIDALLSRLPLLSMRAQLESYFFKLNSVFGLEYGRIGEWLERSYHRPIHIHFFDNIEGISHHTECLSWKPKHQEYSGVYIWKLMEYFCGSLKDFHRSRFFNLI